MDNIKLLNYLRDAVDKERAEKAVFLANGRANSFEEYRHLCGVIRGLATAEALINDLVQKLERSDDD